MDENLYPRFALQTMNTVLSDTPVLVIQGARQVGKSTLVKQIAAECDATTFTLDDNNTLRIAQADPVAFVDQSPNSLLVIDEAQRVPELILPLKVNVDRDRRPGRFLLTGSADLLKVKGVADSLAGRAETVEMYPLSQGELTRRTTAEDFVAWILEDTESQTFQALDPNTVIRGGFPEANLRTETRARSWFLSYISRLADHDAQDLQQGGYADQLTILLRVIAAQGQAELVKAKVARDLGIAEATADSYLRLARTMRLIVEIPVWNRTLRGRVIHRPKVSLIDTGLAAALTNFTAQMSFSPGGLEYFGALVEQFVALELLKQRTWTSVPYDIYHYRDRDGLEVDLIVETFDGTIIAIEVKSGRTVTSKLWKNLAAFRDRFPDRRVIGVLLHGGDTVATLHDWLHILPIPALWEH